jgi:hypothetical protein
MVIVITTKKKTKAKFFSITHLDFTKNVIVDDEC